MEVHRNESQYSRPAIPMSETILLEESFLDAITAITKAEELPGWKRAHWACSLRQVAKALDRPPESLPGRWTAVWQRVGQLHHARVCVEPKTLANHKSNAQAALRWFRREQGLPRRGTPLAPEWRRLRAQLMDRSRLARLSGLIRYCSIRGIAPEGVDEATVDAYMRYRAETTALAADNKARRAIARAWNWCTAHIEDWPRQRLTEPPIKSTEGPHWEDFPEGLRNHVENYLVLLTKPRRSPKGRRVRACRASTIKTRRGDLIACAKTAVRSGIPMDELTSFGTLLKPEIVGQVLEAYWQRDGEEPRTFTIDLAKKLLAVAREVGCLDQEELDRLDDMRANLEQYRRGGLTEKNLKVVRQVLTDQVWGEVVNLPRALMLRARALSDQAPVKAAVTAQIAIGIAILTVAPVRVSNLVGIRLGENLIKPGGSKTPYWLVYPHFDVKNRVDLNFLLDEYLTGLIEEYVQEFRPALLRGSNDDWLFPGGAGGAKDPHLFSTQMIARIQNAIGLRITPHQFRHAAAAIYLKHRPGEYETVRRLLGHRNIRTTIQFYCGLETMHASEAYGRIIRDHLRFQSEDA
jgi:integrase